MQDIQASFGLYSCSIYYVGDVKHPMYLVDLIRIEAVEGVDLSPQRTSFYMHRNPSGEWVMVRHSSLPLSPQLKELAEVVGAQLATCT